MRLWRHWTGVCPNICLPNIGSNNTIRCVGLQAFFSPPPKKKWPPSILPPWSLLLVWWRVAAEQNDILYIIANAELLPSPPTPPCYCVLFLAGSFFAHQLWETHNSIFFFQKRAIFSVKSLWLGARKVLLLRIEVIILACQTFLCNEHCVYLSFYPLIDVHFNYKS